MSFGEAAAAPVRVEEMTLTLEWPSTELISRENRATLCQAVRIDPGRLSGGLEAERSEILRKPMKPRVLVCALMIGLLVAPAASGQGRTFRDLSLKEALQVLQAAGLPVVFSSSVVRDSMRVESEPQGRTPRARLDDLLRPHGLRVEEVAGRLVVVAVEPLRSPPPAQPPA